MEMQYCRCAKCKFRKNNVQHQPCKRCVEGENWPEFVDAGPVKLSTEEFSVRNFK